MTHWPGDAFAWKGLYPRLKMVPQTPAQGAKAAQEQNDRRRALLAALSWET
jgi:hypothetical protein